MSEIDLLLYPDGVIKAIYTEEIDLSRLGPQHIQRASMVEPEEDGWYADMALSSGPKLGPFAKRSQALEAEIAWLKINIFGGKRCQEH